MSFDKTLTEVALQIKQKSHAGVTMDECCSPVNIYTVEPISLHTLFGLFLKSHKPAAAEESVDEWGIYLPKVNHHNLNIHDDKFREMKKVITHRLQEGIEFDTTMQVMLFSKATETSKDHCHVKALYQGQDSGKQQNEEEYAEKLAFLTNKEIPKDFKDLSKFLQSEKGKTVTIGILDGLHRVFAIYFNLMEEYADNEDANDDWMKKIKIPMKVFVPNVRKNLNQVQSDNMLLVARMLSEKIAESRNLSINKTLIDALNMIMEIPTNLYMCDAIAGTVEVESGPQVTQVPVLYADDKTFRNHIDQYKIQENGVQGEVTTFKALTKEIIQILIKSEQCFKQFSLNYPKYSDCLEELKTDKFYDENLEKCMRSFWSKDLLLTPETYMIAVEHGKASNCSINKNATNGHNIDSIIYAVLQTVKTIFYSEEYKQEMKRIIQTMNENNLLTVHRLAYVSVLASTIVETFLKEIKNGCGHPDDGKYYVKPLFRDAEPHVPYHKKRVAKLLLSFVTKELLSIYATKDASTKWFKCEETVLTQLMEAGEGNGIDMQSEHNKASKKDLSVALALMATFSLRAQVENKKNSDITVTKGAQEEQLTKQNLLNKQQLFDLYALHYGSFLRMLLLNSKLRKALLPVLDELIFSRSPVQPHKKQPGGLYELEWSVDDITPKNRFHVCSFGGVRKIFKHFVADDEDENKNKKEIARSDYKRMMDTIEKYFPGLLRKESLSIDVAPSKPNIEIFCNQNLRYFISAERYILDIANSNMCSHKGEPFTYAWNPLDPKNFMLGIEDEARARRIEEKLQENMEEKIELIGNARSFYRFYSTCFKKKQSKGSTDEGQSWDGITAAMMQWYDSRLTSEEKKKEYLRNVVNFAIYHVLPTKLKPKITYGKKDKNGDVEQDVFTHTGENVRSQAVMVPTKIADMMTKLRENKSVFTSAEAYFSCQDIGENEQTQQVQRPNTPPMNGSDGEHDGLRAVSPDDPEEKRKKRTKETRDNVSEHGKKKPRVEKGGSE